MSIIIREQDILSQNPPNDVGMWTEEAIRNYQETHGINYGGSVFVRGEKPNREWSNDRKFGEKPQVTHSKEEYLKQQNERLLEAQKIESNRMASDFDAISKLQKQRDDEVEVLKAQIKSMQEFIEEMKSRKPVEPLKPEGVKRHGLDKIDKRTKAYKELNKAQS